MQDERYYLKDVWAAEPSMYAVYEFDYAAAWKIRCLWCIKNAIRNKFKDDTPEQRRQAQKNAHLKHKLVRFCIDNWDNQFMQEIKEQFLEQKDLLWGILDDWNNCRWKHTRMY